MVVVGSVHKLQCLDVLEEAVGQQGDRVCVCVCPCVCVSVNIGRGYVVVLFEWVDGC